MEIISNRFLFEIFNITFIAFYQNVLIYLFSVAPVYLCYLVRVNSSAASYAAWTNYDCVSATAFLFFLTIEIIADQQQWNFQTAKYELINAKKPLTGDYKRGFITSGLFYYSRHPNFFSEISIWFAVYFFSISAQLSQVVSLATVSGHNFLCIVFNWSSVGAVLLFLLFHGSTRFTEKISSEKYPAYKEYQRTTSMLVPWFPRESSDEWKKQN